MKKKQDKVKKEKRKCYSCRKDIDSKTDIFCEDCVNKPESRKSTTGIYKIYHKL